MERTENLNFSQADKVTAIGKALSSEFRIRILEALEEQEHNVDEAGRSSGTSGFFGGDACPGTGGGRTD